jgi:hypothetical protein
MRTVAFIALLALPLAGCSTALLEDVGEVGEIAPPRLCSETTKVFNTFTMRTTRVAWKGDKADATVTLELTFENDRNFPIALSNSGNGVLYSVQFHLVADKGGSHAPKEAAGVALVREPKQFKEPPRPGPFGYASRPQQREENEADNIRDVNFRINPREPERGKLVFQVPRDNYLLTIERKFEGKPAAGKPSEHIAVCRISAE